MSSRVVALMLCAAVVGPALADTGGGSAGLCLPGEEVFLACPVRAGKLLSLCGTAGGAVEYRFGRHDAIELRQAAPLRPDDPTFQLARYSRAGVERTTVRFERNGVSYLLFDFQEGSRRIAGVDVTLPGAATEQRNACRSPIESHLRRLAGRMACDRDSALQLGNCP